MTWAARPDDGIQDPGLSPVSLGVDRTSDAVHHEGRYAMKAQIPSFSLRPLLLPAVVFCVGVLATLAFAQWSRVQADQVRRDRLDRWVERTQPELVDALQRPAYGLGGARGAMAASGAPLSAAQMAQYVHARDLPREFPGTLGFGVIDRVPRDALDAYQARIAAQYPGGFRVRTSGDAADLYVIRAIEPRDENAAALGFDVGSEAMRRAAAERVFRKGQPTLTGPIRLLQAPSEPGALLLVPVFATGRPSADGSDVVAAVYAPVVYPQLLSGLLPAHDPHLRVDLHDTAAPAEARLLYSSTGTAPTALQRTVAFEFAGRRFEARYSALPAMFAGLQGTPFWVTTLAGLVLSAMAAFVPWLLTQSRDRAMRLAATMTVELERLATVARLTRNAVVITDPAGLIQWANPAFEQLSGYSQDALLGRRPGDLLQYEATDPAAVSAMRHALRRRTAFHGQLRNRSADGREYWVDIEIQPILGAGGALGGFIGIQTDVTESLAQREALRDSEAFLDRTNAVAGVGGWQLDIATGHLDWSAETRRLHDVPADFVPDVTQALQFYDEPARPVIAAAVNRALAEQSGWDLELPLVSYTGRRFWARAVGEVIVEGGAPVRMVGAFQDITARKVAELSLTHNTRLMETTLKSIGDAVLTADNDGRVVWLNPVAERLTGWSHAEARGRPARAVLNLHLEERDEPAPCPIDTCLRERHVVGLATDTVLVTRDGSRRYAIEDSSSPILDEEGVMHGVVMVFNDVTEKRRMAQEMNFRARHDALTGLANRGELEVRLRDALERTRLTGQPGALVFVDLDHFKVINDSCGHHEGDALLRQISEILAQAVRSDDLVARFGGDEFAIVLERCPIGKALAIANSLCSRVDTHRYAADDGRRFRVGASVGVVPLDARWLSVPSLLQAADEACYSAKDEGRGRVVLRDGAALLAHTEHVSQWGARIEHALDSDGFALLAQRLVTLDGERTGLHCEVLLRLVGEDGRLVAPGAFMPSAERYQLASRIDRWVLQRVLGMLSTRVLEGVGRVAVNLSGQSVGDSEFHRFARRAIAESGVRPDVLALEITETAAITNLAQAGRFIADMRALGVQVMLDDFGAGASSFGYLKQLQVDVIKIDGQFVKGLLASPLDESAVRCFADVARVLGLQTVAEHVEDAATAERLSALGIGLGQGYHFHKPEDFARVLDAHAGARSAVA